MMLRRCSRLSSLSQQVQKKTKKKVEREEKEEKVTVCGAMQEEEEMGRSRLKKM